MCGFVLGVNLAFWSCVREAVGNVLQKFDIERPTPQPAIFISKRQAFRRDALYCSDVFQVSAPQAFIVDRVFETVKVSEHVTNANVVYREFVGVEHGQNR